MGVRVPAQLAEAFALTAARSGRTASDELRRLITDRVADAAQEQTRRGVRRGSADAQPMQAANDDATT